MKPPVLADVARAAGVSLSTASRALRGEGRVAHHTRRRVRAEASRLGYALYEQSDVGDAEDGTIPGLQHLLMLVPAMNALPFFGETLAAVHEAAAQYGFQTATRFVDNTFRIIDVLRAEQSQYDAAIVCTWADLSEAEAEAVEKLSYPVVFVNRYVPGRTYSVTHDDFAAGMKAADYLIRMGHSRIAHLAGNVNISSLRDRTAGFRLALEAAGAYDPILFAEPGKYNHLEWVVKVIRQFLDLPDPPTAIWAFNDRIAMHVLVALRSCGIAVPRDISVMGFDNMGYSQDVQLTTFSFRSRELGKQAVHMLHGIFTKTFTEPVRICVLPTFIPGITVGMHANSS